MTARRQVAALAMSLVFPGFGHGLIEKRWRMAAFAVGDLLATVSVLQTVWGLVMSIAIRLVAAGDAFWYARKYEGQEGSWGWAGVAALIGTVGLVFANFAVEGFEIPSDSMVPALRVDDQIYVDKLSIAWRKPERGEVLVFTQPCAHKPYVKRVMALAGDTVEVRCGALHVNGTEIARLPERPGWFREAIGGHTYLVPEDTKHDFPQTDLMLAPSCVQGNFYDTPVHDQPQGKLVETKPRGTATSACDLQLHFVVPPKSFFVMGDNRNNANDSRLWGVVPEKAIIGRVIGIVSPWSRFGDFE